VVGSPAMEDDGECWKSNSGGRLTAQQNRERERKGDRDSMGTTSKRARERQKHKGNDETNTMVCSPLAKDERR
jgi:hypothetical protein